MSKILNCALMIAALTIALTATAQTALPPHLTAQYPHIPFTHEGEPLAPDSSNFVTASLVVFSPSDVIYSSLGHCSMRLECPHAHDAQGNPVRLDYCFTLETDIETSDYIRFFAGRANAAFRAVPTDEFVDYYRQQGRGGMQYELNLTPHQKQELWRLLDTDMIAEAHRKFNYIQNNCASALLITLEQALANDTIRFRWPTVMAEGVANGKVVRYATRKANWNRFWCMTLMGSEADAHWPRENLVSPELFPAILKQSAIVDADGHERGIVLAEKELLPTNTHFTNSLFSPLFTFGLLLVVALVVTLLEWLSHKRKAARRFDVILFVLQSVAGLLLLYMSFVSGLFGIHWNWYLIVFNPIPLLLWLTCRKRPWYPRVYGYYAVVLALFVMATPLSQQLDWGHQLITATLLVRCLSRAMSHKLA